MKKNRSNSLREIVINSPIEGRTKDYANVGTSIRGRSKYSRPKALIELLDVANSVEPGLFEPDVTSTEAVPHRAEIVGFCWRFVSDEDWEAFDKATAKTRVWARLTELAEMLFRNVSDPIVRNEWIDRTMEQVKECITFSKGPTAAITNASCEIGWFYDDHVMPIRSTLFYIAEHFANVRRHGRGSEDIGGIRVASTIMFKGSIATAVDSGGVGAAIIGVDCDLIRICEVCGRLFWATRAKSKTDTKSCLNVLTQRNFRERADNLASNERRRENYRIKKRRIAK